MITINDVPIEYRTYFRGKYNAAVNFCVKCGTYLETSTQKEIGFSELDGEVVLIYECQKCFKIQYHHIKNIQHIGSLILLMKLKEKL